MTQQNWIQIAGDDARESESPMIRVGTDTDINDSSHSSCSSSYQAPLYSDKLLRRHSLKEIASFTWETGSSSSSSGSSSSECCP